MINVDNTSITYPHKAGRDVVIVQRGGCHAWNGEGNGAPSYSQVRPYCLLKRAYFHSAATPNNIRTLLGSGFATLKTGSWHTCALLPFGEPLLLPSSEF